MNQVNECVAPDCMYKWSGCIYPAAKNENYPDNSEFGEYWNLCNTCFYEECSPSGDEDRDEEDSEDDEEEEDGDKVTTHLRNTYQ